MIEWVTESLSQAKILSEAIHHSKCETASLHLGMRLINRCMGGCLTERLHDGVSDWETERVGGWVIEWVTQSLSQDLIERLHDGVNDCDTE